MLSGVWREDEWYIVCTEKHYRNRCLHKRKPLHLFFLNRPFLLISGADQEPRAFLDRCPHRNLPLSMGRLTDENELECAYHGWRFDAQGKCAAIPGNDEFKKAPGTSALDLCALPTSVSQGYIWIFFGDSGSKDFRDRNPYVFPFLDTSEYKTLRMETEVAAPLTPVIENLLDVAHTRYLHRGLFRNPEKRKESVRAVIKSGERSAEAEYIGERRPNGLLANLLFPSGTEVFHVDRFLLPSITQVIYRIGKSHLILNGFLTPINEERLKLFALISIRHYLPRFFLLVLKNTLGKVLLQQDLRILKAQTENILRFGALDFHSTKIDLLSPEIEKLLNGEKIVGSADRNVTLNF